jgi:hypothetical protein
MNFEYNITTMCMMKATNTILPTQIILEREECFGGRPIVNLKV